VKTLLSRERVNVFVSKCENCVFNAGLYQYAAGWMVCNKLGVQRIEDLPPDCSLKQTAEGLRKDMAHFL